MKKNLKKDYKEISFIDFEDLPITVPFRYFPKAKYVIRPSKHSQLHKYNGQTDQKTKKIR